MRRRRRSRNVERIILYGLVFLAAVLLQFVVRKERAEEPDSLQGLLEARKELAGIDGGLDTESVPEGKTSDIDMWAYILANREKYPEELFKLACKNEETLDYVYGYPFYAGNDEEIDLTKEASDEHVPLLLQWDKRWGYRKYGSGLIGYTGCGPTCLSMVSLFLTGDEKYDPSYVAAYAEREGYYVPGSGTGWDLMSVGCKAFGLAARELSLDESNVCDALDRGQPVICAVRKGDFTESGHFIVLTGYDADGFLVNDPNSIEKSRTHWKWERLSMQIRNLWAFEKAGEVHLTDHFGAYFR